MSATRDVLALLHTASLVVFVAMAFLSSRKRAGEVYFLLIQHNDCIRGHLNPLLLLRYAKRIEAAKW